MATGDYSLLTAEPGQHFCQYNEPRSLLKLFVNFVPFCSNVRVN